MLQKGSYFLNVGLLIVFLNSCYLNNVGLFLAFFKSDQETGNNQNKYLFIPDFSKLLAEIGQYDI